MPHHWRRGLHDEFEWRRERMGELQAELAKVDIKLSPTALGATLKAARRGVGKQVVLRTRVGRLISGWSEQLDV